jgi:hypothetical protein
MALADSGGGTSDVPAGAISGQIEITIEAIRRIARENMTAMQDNAEGQSRDFRTLDLPPSAFGQVPIAQTVGAQHQAAHEVFMTTIDGVIADLQHFASNLEASCAAHEATDEQSAVDAQRAGQGALSGLNESMTGYQSQADQNFDNAGAERRDELGEIPPESDQREGSEPSADQTGSPAGSDGTAGSAGPGSTDAGGFDGDSPADSPAASPTDAAGFDGDAAPAPVATTFDADADGTLDVLEPALQPPGSTSQAQ